MKPTVRRFSAVEAAARFTTTTATKRKVETVWRILARCGVKAAPGMAG